MQEVGRQRQVIAMRPFVKERGEGLRLTFAKGGWLQCNLLRSVVRQLDVRTTPVNVMRHFKFDAFKPEGRVQMRTENRSLLQS